MTLYRPEIEAAARDFGLDPDLLEALVMAESAGEADAFRFEPDFWRRYLANHPDYKGKNPRRVSSSYGLCQVMYSTACNLGFKAQPESLFLPDVSLHFGAMYLSRLLKWAGGNAAQALAAYNGGQGNWTAEGPQSYAAKVLRFRDEIRKGLA
jgi:soluble lytic murein transglycosylase-like protein